MLKFDNKTQEQVEAKIGRKLDKDDLKICQFWATIAGFILFAVFVTFAYLVYFLIKEL